MPHRWICGVFEEMRGLDKTKNYSAMLGLIEEAQSLANRMESKLYDTKDWHEFQKQIKKLKKKGDKLQEQVDELKKELEE